MKPTLGLSLSLILLVWAGSASAQLTTTKYGLSHPNDFDFRKSFPLSFTVPNRAFAGQLEGSYQYATGRFDSIAVPPDCGAGSTALTQVDRDYTPILGQILLTEDHSCIPTSTGPGCTAGDPGRIGAMCHLPLGTASATDDGGTDQLDLQVRYECGAGGTCAIAAGTSCTVQIPKTTPTTPIDQRSDLVAYVILKNQFGLQFETSSPFSLGGTSSADPADGCLARNVQPETTTGQRYLLPASRGGNGTMTFIRWNEDPTADPATDKTTSLYRHGDAGKSCCNSVTNTICANNFNFPEYDLTGLLGEINCQSAADGFNLLVQTPDWVFDGGPATNFHTDPDFVMPGQRTGVCRVNRHRSCTTLSPVPAGYGPQTDCTTLDINPDPGVFEPDSCDFREDGFRATRPRNLANGYPSTAECGLSLLVLRGTAGGNCVLMDRYVQDGDPGLSCDVVNIGARTRWDGNCDGSPDGPDLCPLLNEYDPVADADDDCGDPLDPNYPLPACRGDECECGDQNLDGLVDVTDIPAINNAIFGAVYAQPVCDTNLDYLCTVSDIVGVSNEIFRPGSAICPHITTANCGNGELDPGEDCDDGNRLSGDGCSAICRDETP
jgi:cysteine-rich repeat protein